MSFILGIMEAKLAMATDPEEIEARTQVLADYRVAVARIEQIKADAQAEAEEPSA